MPSRILTSAVLATLLAIGFEASVGRAADPVVAAAPQVSPPATSAADSDVSRAKADRAIAAGLAFLKKNQNPDGSWGAATEPPAISALALRAFAKDGQAKDEAVAKGYAKLLSYQVADGGIYRDLLANYNTCIALSALAAADDPAFAPAIEKATAYIKGLQWTPETRPEYAGKPTDKIPEANQGKQVVKDDKDPFYGGWGYGGRSKAPGRPDLSNAQLAIEALHDAGVTADDPAMKRAIAFLTRLQNFSETNDQAWAGNDGGFIYSPGGDRNGETNAGEYTDASGKRLLRSYGSMTYAGLKSMVYAGLTKEDPRVKAAIDWVSANWTLDENPGMKAAAPENAKAGLFYYYHSLSRALAAHGEPTLTLAGGRVVDWRVELIDKLATSQAADGSWVGEKRWMESNPVLVTSFAVQALQEARDDLKKPAK